MNMIEVSNLHKSFGEIHAVNDISFSVEQGELFAFLGVNGAGKSTTISILCGQLQKDSGDVRICGEEDAPLGRILGVIFQNSVLDQALTVKENLECRAALYGIVGDAFSGRLLELARMLDFEDLLDRTVGKLSGGQRRRIDIARALVHSPKILILDEPTTGLDPQTRRLLWEVISGLRAKEGMTVFLTTHYMEEAADADHIVIMDAGKIIAKGTPLSLKNTYARDYITLYGVEESLVRSLSLPYASVADGYRIEVESTAAATKLILANPEIFVDYEVVKGKMDDVFLAATGKRMEGGMEG